MSEFSDDLQQQIKTRRVGLRELLDLGDHAYLELILIGYDELSGAPRIAVSPRLQGGSIRRGRYGPANSLEVQRDGDTPGEAEADESDLVAEADED